MITYFIKVILCTVVFLVPYLVIRNRPYPSISRIYLLIASVLPFILPLIKISTSVSPLPISVLRAVQLPEVVVGANAAPRYSGINMLFVYLVIAGLLLLLNIGRLMLWRHRMKAADSVVINGLRLSKNTGYGPGSFGRIVFIPGDTISESVLKHEQSHIRHLHYVDLFLLRFLRSIFWPNFLLYLIERELRMVHEFQSDLEACGTDRVAYSELLLSETLRTNLRLAHTFSHQPLKRRIMLLQKTSHSGRKKYFFTGAGISIILLVMSVLVVQCRQETATLVMDHGSPDTTTIMMGLVPVHKVGNAFYVNAREVDSSEYSLVKDKATEMASVLSKGDSVAFPDILLYGAINPGGDSIYKSADSMPEFIGDREKFLIDNLKYPNDARKAKTEGRVVIRFVVDETGKVVSPEIMKSSGNSLLDAEGIRVVRSMPDWKPGSMSDGTKVSVYYYLPISFQLE